MAEPDKIAGIILAGGRSSRMGQNKALLNYHGKPLIDHMIGQMQQTGVGQVFISGDLEGYECLPDRVAFSGPAAAIRDIHHQLSKDWQGLLIIPVDMPFLALESLKKLMTYSEGACYESWPLPLYLPSEKQPGEGDSIRQMISGMGIKTLILSDSSAAGFNNLNTPEEWQKAVE